MLLISPTKTLFHAEYTESCQPSYGGNVFSDQIEPSTGEQDCQVMMVMMMQYQNIQHNTTEYHMGIQHPINKQILQTIPVNNCRNVAKPNCRQIAEEQCREVTKTIFKIQAI